MRARPGWLVVMLLLLGAGAAPPAGATISGTVNVTDDAGKPVADPADVWVYLEPVHPAFDADPPGKGVRAAIRQERETFVPHVVVVPEGAVVAFPNYDHEDHNVFSPTPPEFNLGRWPTDHTGHTREFDDPGEFDIYCDIHQKMTAKVLVVPTRYFAPVTRGAFALAHVAPGTYRVVLWMPDVYDHTTKKTVTVTPGATLVLPPMDLHPGHRRAHTRFDGSAYRCPPYCP